MKKMVLCVFGGLIGLTLCFSCAAEQTVGKGADLEAIGTETGNPAQTLIRNKSDDEIIALYKKPCEQLYADLAIITATIQQKKTTDLTMIRTLKKHDLCMQIKQNAMQELQRTMKSGIAPQPDQQTSPEKKQGKLLRRVFLGGAIKGCVKP
jgi:hypothetical protein